MSYEEFREWLEAQLQKRGWNLAELARRGNIDLSHLTRVAGGERIPGPATCVKIARAFRIPPEDVLRRVGVLTTTPSQVEGMEELAMYFAAFSPDDRKRLILLARALYQANEDDEESE